jgi:hypothetical protein
MDDRPGMGRRSAKTIRLQRRHPRKLDIGISSGAFMAVQFGTAWSSVIRGVGVVAGGPYWCAKADANDFMNGYTLPIMTATGSCMTGPPRDVKRSFEKADAKAASGDIDSLQMIARQKIYMFHGYNDAVWRGRSRMRRRISIVTIWARPTAAISTTRPPSERALAGGCADKPVDGINACQVNASTFHQQLRL